MRDMNFIWKTKLCFLKIHSKQTDSRSSHADDKKDCDQGFIDFAGGDRASDWRIVSSLQERPVEEWGSSGSLELN